MIDSHCHLDYLDDPDGAVVPTLAAIVSVGTNPDRNRATLALAERHPTVWAAVGVHPNEASLAVDAKVRAEVERQAAHPRVVAIGETGFDRYWDKETLESQRASFDWQADLAARKGCALILHVRDRESSDTAAAAAVAAIREAGHGRGVLHCFNGSRALLEAGLELGWMVSFAGNLTYKSASALREVAATIPPDRLLVETDSPFLTPVPKRGQRNTPANVHHTAAVLADALGLPLDHLEPILDRNARALYRLDDTAAV